MATGTQEAAKLEQLSHENPDEIEVAAGREREQLEGWVPELAGEAEVREALEKAFDYRGDITITRKDGSKIEGYLFDRRTGFSLADSFVRIIPTNEKTKVNVAYADIAALAFSGRDTAAGKTFEAWVAKYWAKRPPERRTFRSSPKSWTDCIELPVEAILFRHGKSGRLRVFITGATGFVGGHVAQSYAAEGAKLRLLTRQGSRTDSLAGIDAEMVLGDLREVEKLRSAMTGCDALVHVAADYRLWVRDPDEMYAANVTGTRELLKLAREVGVQRVVYTSSVATMGFKADGTIVDESTPVSLDDMIGHYKRSKFLGEQEAIAAARNGQHVMILNPTTPIGPGDAKPTPTGRIIVDFLNKQFPAYVDTGLNLVDVNEVARMHVVALERGTPGERYILGGENLTLKQILDRMSAITGLPSPTMKVPHAVAMAFAFFDETITGKLRGKEPRATVEAVRMGKKMMFASSAKAERELGFQVLPVYSALRAAIEWFLAHGYAPKP